jgi:MerR family redox-sensitive transcriptional activator SoxR
MRAYKLKLTSSQEGNYMATFSISEIAQKAGVETSTIRYYERIGLLPRPKRVNSRRVYEEDVLKWLALIKTTKAAGFTIAEIQTLMQLWKTEGRSPKNWREFVERKLTETEALINEALRTKRILDSALACGCWDEYIMPLEAYVSSFDVPKPV